MTCVPLRAGTALCASLALVLTGCVQGPNYEKPAVEVPSAYRFGDQAYMLQAGDGQYAWWNSFGDPVLDGLVRECLANNRDLRIATARVDEFAAHLRVLLEHRESARRLARNAYRRCLTQFLPPRHLAQYADLFEALLGRS